MPRRRTKKVFRPLREEKPNPPVVAPAASRSSSWDALSPRLVVLDNVAWPRLREDASPSIGFLAAPPLRQKSPSAKPEPEAPQAAEPEPRKLTGASWDYSRPAGLVATPPLPGAPPLGPSLILPSFPAAMAPPPPGPPPPGPPPPDASLVPCRSRAPRLPPAAPPQASADDDETLQCPITYELFEDPVVLEGDGRTYEREAIQDWLRRGNRTSPCTGVMLDRASTKLIPDAAMRERVAAFNAAFTPAPPPPAGPPPLVASQFLPLSHAPPPPPEAPPPLVASQFLPPASSTSPPSPRPEASQEQWSRQGALPLAVDEATRLPLAVDEATLPIAVEEATRPGDDPSQIFEAFWAHPQWLPDNALRAAIDGVSPFVGLVNKVKSRSAWPDVYRLDLLAQRRDPPPSREQLLLCVAARACLLVLLTRLEKFDEKKGPWPFAQPGKCELCEGSQCRLKCGRCDTNFCRACLRKHTANNRACPLCAATVVLDLETGAPLAANELLPTRSLLTPTSLLLTPPSPVPAAPPPPASAEEEREIAYAIQLSLEAPRPAPVPSPPAPCAVPPSPVTVIVDLQNVGFYNGGDNYWTNIELVFKYYQARNIQAIAFLGRNIVRREASRMRRLPDWIKDRIGELPSNCRERDNDDRFMLHTAMDRSCSFVTNDNLRDWGADERLDGEHAARLRDDRFHEKYHIMYTFLHGQFVPDKDPVTTPDDAETRY